MWIFNMGVSLPYLMWFSVGAFVTFGFNEGFGTLYLITCAAIYVLSVAINHWRPCPSCKGKGSKTGRLFDYASRPCGHCGGSGKKTRLGSLPFAAMRRR